MPLVEQWIDSFPQFCVRFSLFLSRFLEFPWTDIQKPSSAKDGDNSALESNTSTCGALHTLAEMLLGLAS
jgi:hypothetical protein